MGWPHVDAYAQYSKDAARCAWEAGLSKAVLGIDSVEKTSGGGDSVEETNGGGGSVKSIPKKQVVDDAEDAMPESDVPLRSSFYNFTRVPTMGDSKVTVVQV